VSVHTGEPQQLPPLGNGPRPPGRPELWAPSDRRWDRIRYTLLIGWILVIAATPFLGERAASWDDVQKLVASGEVKTVRISGGLPAHSTGYSVAQVHWRHGLLRYTAEVVQARGPRGPRGAATGTGIPVIRTSPGDRLAALQPELHVTRDQRSPDGGELFGWQVPIALAISAFLLFLAALGLLVSGPHPWRATRWAWFWLLLTPVSSIPFLAFMMLSGPTAGVPGPRDPRRRLTGGWAFMLSVALMGLLEHHRW
jgi:hypothetical protein